MTDLEFALEIEKTVTGPYGPMAVSIDDTLKLVKLVKDSIALRDFDQKRIELASQINRDLIKSYCEQEKEFEAKIAIVQEALEKVINAKEMALTESRDYLILTLKSLGEKDE